MPAARISGQGEIVGAGGVPAADRFCWHPAARVIDAAGAVHAAAHASPQVPVQVIADRPGALALQQVLALAAAGLAFRIGDAADAPTAGAVPMFETLTSGTSGRPRRIRRTQASWIASFAVNAGLFGIGPCVAGAVLGRLVHSLALYGALEALHLGAVLHLLDGLRPDR
ncbi:MAG TPA: hypothetical protein VGA75_09170, partial [Paracoccaceae bacterium]